MAKRSDALRGDGDLCDLFELAVFLFERPNTSRFEISKNVCAIEWRIWIASINKASGNRWAELVWVGENRKRVVGFGFSVIFGKRFKPFIDIPTMVLPRPNDGDFFIGVLTDVPNP